MLQLCHISDIIIINVYNLKSNELQIQSWQAIQQVIQKIEEKILLLEDFNVHYLFWNNSQIIIKVQLEHFCIIIITNDLSLLTSCELLIWRRDNQQSVIDFTFVSETISELVLFCDLMNHWTITQDHISIDIQIAMLTKKSVLSKCYMLEKLNKKKLKWHLLQSE